MVIIHLGRENIKSILKPMTYKGIAPIIIILIISAVSLASLGGYLYFSKQENQPQQQITKLEEQTDEHGCLISLGYSWCEVKKKCIKLEQEICENITTTTTPEPNVNLATTTTTKVSHPPLPQITTITTTTFPTTTTTIPTINTTIQTTTSLSAVTTTTIPLVVVTNTTIPFIDMIIKDLKINGLPIESDFIRLELGYENKISFIERNIGKYLAELHTTGIFEDYNPEPLATKKIEVGNESDYYLEFPYTCTTPGYHNIKIKVDIYNKIKETNEENNSVNIIIYCDCSPSLSTTTTSIMTISTTTTKPIITIPTKKPSTGFIIKP